MAGTLLAADADGGDERVVAVADAWCAQGLGPPAAPLVALREVALDAEPEIRAE